MIFLTEAQFPVQKAMEPDLEKSYCLLESHLIYKALYKLDISELSMITGVTFISKNNLNEEVCYEIFRLYSADAIDYKNHIWSNNSDRGKFPDDNELSDDKKRETALKLIRMINIITFKSPVAHSKGISSKHLSLKSEYMVYLPYIGSLLTEVISTIPFENIKSYSSYSYFNSKEIFSTELKDYLEIKSSLQALRNIYDNEIRDNELDVRAYYPQNLLNVLGLDNEIHKVKKSDKRRAFLSGEDMYLTMRSINSLLSDKLFFAYEMPEGLTRHQSTGAPNAFFHINRLGDKQIFDLGQLIARMEKDIFAILHDSERKSYSYFSSYDRIELTTKEVIRKEITTIFLSILMDRGKIQGQKKLVYPIVTTNLFNSLLKSVDSLSMLSEVADDLKEDLSVDESLFDPLFWLQLHSHIMRKSHRSLEREKAESLVKSIDFIQSAGHKWIIRNLIEQDIRITCIPRNLGLLYIIIIIKSEKRLSLLELRKLFIMHFGDAKAVEKKELSDIDKALARQGSLYYNTQTDKQRKKICKAIDNLFKSEKNNGLSEIESHIVYEDYGYTYKAIVNKTKLQCNIEGFTLDR